MLSQKAKVLQKLGGKTMLHHLLLKAKQISSKISVVVGFDKDGVEISVKYSGDSTYTYLGKSPIDSFIAPKLWGWLSHKLKLKYNNLEFEIDGKNNYDYLMPETTIEVPENHKVFLGSKVNMFLQGINFEETQIQSFSIA